MVDLAKAHVSALNRLINNKQLKKYEYFNVGTGKGHSVLEIIKACEKITNSEIKFNFRPRRKGDIGILISDIEKAKKKLDFKISFENIDDTIKTAWEWHKWLYNHKRAWLLYKMKICVAGAGYVGFSLSVLLSQKHKVISFDVSDKTVDIINNYKSPIKDEAINEARTLTGVSHLKNENLGNLSGGEFQRVLLARAISKKPDLLVLDEPVQGVDYTGEIALYELIKKISDTLNCGILLISHDLHTVMKATDHVVCLNGHVCCSGSPIDVARNNEYKTLFGDQASTLLSVYEHKHDHTHSTDGSINEKKH